MLEHADCRRRPGDAVARVTVYRVIRGSTTQTTLMSRPLVSPLTAIISTRSPRAVVTSTRSPGWIFTFRFSLPSANLALRCQWLLPAETSRKLRRAPSGSYQITRTGNSANTGSGVISPTPDSSASAARSRSKGSRSDEA